MRRRQLILGLIGMVLLLPHPAHAQTDTQVIESDSPYVVPSGPWTRVLDDAASHGSYLESTGAPDNALTFETSSTYLEILYATGPNYGTLVVEIDGTIRRTIITNGPPAVSNRATFTGLEARPQVIRVYAPAGQIIAVDAFAVGFPYTTATPPSSDAPPSTPSPSATVTDPVVTDFDIRTILPNRIRFTVR